MRSNRTHGVAKPSRRRDRWLATLGCVTLAGCGSLAGADPDSFLPIDPSGDWRIIPDDPDLLDNCISLGPGNVLFYTVRCDGMNDLISAERFEIQGGVWLILDLTVQDRNGAVGRIQITGTLIDHDTIDGQVQITGGLFNQNMVFDMTMIR